MSRKHEAEHVLYLLTDPDGKVWARVVRRDATRRWWGAVFTLGGLADEPGSPERWRLHHWCRMAPPTRACGLSPQVSMMYTEVRAVPAQVLEVAVP
jgi:hypothetical protein